MKITGLFLLLAFHLNIASAAVPLTTLSTDPYTTAGAQHATEVEPDTFSFGATIVSTFQIGRIFDGGATNIGFATSKDSGVTWSHGVLPMITTAEGGPFPRASDPSVAYDAAHNVWIIASLALATSPSPHGVGIVVSRSTNGGLTWAAPNTVTQSGDVDKNWIVCDNTPSSPFYGHCYVVWDDVAANGRIRISVSTNGGLTWAAPLTTADNATGVGGQPLVQPNGNVIVPFLSSGQTQIRIVRSLTGGASWRNSFAVANVSSRRVAGGLRSEPLPTAEIDGAGRIFVAWQDCRFQSSCQRNDIVFISSSDGLNWSSVRRVPIHAVNSTFDHFIPGLAVDKSTSGSSARLGLAYYYYPNGNCTASTCMLNVGFISSTNAGATWSAPTNLAGPMSVSWLANTNQGRMVGDYISSSFSNGTVHPVFSLASAPSGGVFNQRMVSPQAGLNLDETIDEEVSEEFPGTETRAIDSEERTPPTEDHFPIRRIQ